MANLHLDFICPVRPASRLAWIFGMGTLVGLVMLMAWNYAVLEPDVDLKTAQLRKIRQELSSHAPPAPKLSEKQLVAEWQKALEISHHLATPWQVLFSMLESHEDQNVALLSIDPDIAKKDLVISGEARNLESLLDYVRFLQSQRILRDVTLLSHQINQQDKDKPVRFRISAIWEHGK